MGAAPVVRAQFWMSVLTDLRNRGIKGTFFVVCDGPKGLPEVVSNVSPDALVQTSSVDTGRRRDGLAGHRTIGRGPIETRASRPSCRPVPPGGGGPRSGQRELRFERRDEVPARPAVR